MIIGNCEETKIDIEINPDTEEKTEKIQKRKIPMLFVRGDIIILISPNLKLKSL